MSDYPVRYEMDYQEEHSRLTTFFRTLVAIPALIYALIYGLVATIALVIAWFALVMSGRYPPGLYNMVAGNVRIYGRLSAYTFLLTDSYPPFAADEAPGYPCRVTVGPPQESYDRLTVAFRLIVGIPTIFLNWLFTIWAELMAFAAWVVIVVTGRLPRGLYEQQIFAERYRARAMAYLGLLTDRQPPVSDQPAAGPAAGA